MPRCRHSCGLPHLVHRCGAGRHPDRETARRLRPREACTVRQASPRVVLTENSANPAANSAARHGQCQHHNRSDLDNLHDGVPCQPPAVHTSKTAAIEAFPIQLDRMSVHPFANRDVCGIPTAERKQLQFKSALKFNPLSPERRPLPPAAPAIADCLHVNPAIRLVACPPFSDRFHLTRFGFANATRHASANSAKGARANPSFNSGQSCPDGSWTRDRPELHLGGNVAIPDLPGRQCSTPLGQSAGWCLQWAAFRTCAGRRLAGI